MEKEKDKNEVIKGKKKRIIVILCIIGIIAMFGLGLLIGTISFNMINKNDEPQNADENIIENEGDDDVLTVPLDEKNTPTPEPVVTPTPSDDAQPVETKYYIKVNYGANVVTVYKKDSNRKLYSASKNYGMFLPEMQHQLQEFTL